MSRIVTSGALVVLLLSMVSCAELVEWVQGVVVRVSPAEVVLPPGGSQVFTVVVTGAQDAGVVWSATEGTIVGEGLTVTYHAPSKPVSVTVTARSAEDPTRFGSAAVVVEAGTEFEAVPSYVTVGDAALQPGVMDGGARVVRFDIGWEESWRGPMRPSYVEALDNWDAAWVFVKYRVDGGPWLHASLRTSGHAGPPGVAIDTPADGRGVFIYRDAPGYGALSAVGVELIWDAAFDGVPVDASVDVRVFGIDMVFVPGGPFWVGTGKDAWGSFRAGSSLKPFEVVAQDSISLGGGAGQLNWTPWSASGDPAGTTNPAFPTGFAAFYVMKYELTQGQYVAFLNTLTQAQAEARMRGSYGGAFRHAITGGRPGEYHTTLPYVAIPYMSWADGVAFADWAGLRPMTELEFEKAARGPRLPIAVGSSCAYEYAWGTTRATYAEGIADGGLISERATPLEANINGSHCGLETMPYAPLRVGSFAAPGMTREQAGAGFYGAMELSGNVFEPSVTVGHPVGQAFTGAHGDGALDPLGEADAPAWPGADGIGGGVRGGSFAAGLWGAEVSNRWGAAIDNLGMVDAGWRGVRSAP